MGPNKSSSNFLCEKKCQPDTPYYRTLQNDKFLNDIIIDFFLLFLEVTKLTSEEKLQVHIFTTMFYKRLLTVPEQIPKENSFEKNETLSDAQKQHMRVKGWTKKVNLFEKKLIIVPICEQSHWYLVIVMNLGQPDISGSSIVVLDSMGGTQPEAVRVVKSYLEQEMIAKTGKLVDLSGLRVEVLKVPQQDNYVDCGIGWIRVTFFPTKIAAYAFCVPFRH